MYLENFPSFKGQFDMNNFAFNPSEFEETKRLAGNAWRNADGKADGFAMIALAGLVTEKLSPLTLAMSVYDDMQPRTAKGKLAEPKESDNGTISVSSLRSAKGGEGAKACLEAIYYIANNRDQDSDAVAAFIRGDKGAKRLFPLKAYLAKVKADAAREAAKGLGEPTSEREGDEPLSEPVGAIEAMAVAIGAMDGETLRANAIPLGLLMEAIRDASARLAAADILESKAA